MSVRRRAGVFAAASRRSAAGREAAPEVSGGWQWTASPCAYGAVPALHDVTLEVAGGGLVTLVGGACLLIDQAETAGR